MELSYEEEVYIIFLLKEAILKNSKIIESSLSSVVIEDCENDILLCKKLIKSISDKREEK